MKILQINCVYKKGSTGKIVYDIHCSLQNNGCESIVCYGRGEKIRENNVYKTCGELYSKFNNLVSRITGIMYGGCFFSTNTLINIIKRERPDVVHVHCINGYFVNIYRLMSYLNQNRIKTILTLHSEFMYTANCGHSFECNKWETGCGSCPRLRKETKSFYFDNTAFSWKKMRKAFVGFDDLIVTSVSPWLQERAQRSPILQGKKHMTILNGIDTSVFRMHDKKTLEYESGFENKKIIFHATAYFCSDKDHIKGGYYVLEMAKRFLNIDNRVLFLIAGKHEDMGEVPENIVFLGNISDQDKLAEYYSLADVTLLASKKETFSMIVAESLCCGTPVVGFEAGAPELITIKEFSSFVSYGDCDKLFNELNLYLNHENIDKQTISHIADLKYGKDVMVKEYEAVYKELARDENV